MVLYWLSKCGYECAKIDHTGTDLIASIEGVRIGISVQGRSRYPGKEKESVNLHPFEDARVACKPFGLIPYSAIVVDRGTAISCYLLKLDYLETIAGGAALRTWSMGEKFLNACRDDPKIAQFELGGSAHWQAHGGSKVLKAMIAA